MTYDSMLPEDRPASPIDGRFHLHEVAGRGGMGVVWRAWDQAAQTWVAVKVLHAMRATVAARFEREIRLLESLGDPQIVRYLDQGLLPDGRRYLVMEWLEGETLSARIQRGALPIEEAVSLGRRLASALGTAHRKGVIHRDFKPSNVLLVGGRLEDPRLLDFGVARDVESETHLTASEAILGTPGYVAPEQARSSRLADPRADIYALGVVLYESMTGCLPFGGHTPIERLMAPLQSPPTPLRHRRPDASPYLEQLLERMLARDPSHRPQDGDTAASWLANASASLHGGTAIDTVLELPPATHAGLTPGGTGVGDLFSSVPLGPEMVDSLDIAPTRRAPKRAERRPWVWIALAGAMLLVGLGGGYWLSLNAPATANSREDTRDKEREERRRKRQVAPAPTTTNRQERPRDEPFAATPLSSKCPPSSTNCRILPRRFWDGATVEELHAYIHKRAMKHFPRAEAAAVIIPHAQRGMLHPRRLEGGYMMLTYSLGGRALSATLAFAYTSFSRSNTTMTALPGPGDFTLMQKCTLEQAYGAIFGGTDARWRTSPIDAMALRNVGATGKWVPMWNMGDGWVDMTTCRLLKSP